MSSVRLYRAAIAILISVGMCAFALYGCSEQRQSASSQAGSASVQSAPVVALEKAPVMLDESFGGVYIEPTIDEFNKLGFKFGDSVDVEFSNGYKIQDIPYYNGYYVDAGDTLLVGYPGYPHIEAAICFGDPLWEVAGLKEGDTASVTLRSPGAYLNVQEAFDVTYTNDRSDYGSDEEFANFRTFYGGSVKPDVAYRSASPINNDYNRAPYVEELMKKAGIAFVLNMSENEDEVNALITEDIRQGIDVSRYEELITTNCAVLLDCSANYRSESYARLLASGLVDMAKHEGPYLVHCVEGKDRTGFACLLVEALCGATYDEMLSDYMMSYANYYGITKDSDPEKYEAIRGLQFDGMLRFLAGAEKNADLTAIDYIGPARDYLRMGGMTDDQIDALVSRLSK